MFWHKDYFHKHVPAFYDEATIILGNGAMIGIFIEVQLMSMFLIALHFGLFGTTKLSYYRNKFGIGKYDCIHSGVR